jgi:phosphatidylinositol alpha-1,6-mannosyltransferase
MNMLFITEKFPPSEGGSRVYYYNLCKNYDGGNVVVLTKKVNGYEEFDRLQNFKIIRKGHPLPDWKYFRYPRVFATILRTLSVVWLEKINVLHCGEFLPAGIVGLILKKLLRKPYVYYVHGEAITWFKQFPLQYRLFNLVLRNADRIVAACTYAEEGLRLDYRVPETKIVKITPGVDYGRFDPEWKDTNLLRELGLKGKKVLLTVGRLIERKGQDTVIRALPKILSEVPDAVYVIGGRGYYEEKLKTLVSELGVKENVRFLGFVPNDKLKGLYSICDVFVMINRDTKQEGPEGFGMVFTEASAAGCATIGGMSGGTEDSILQGVSGFRVDPLDVDGVATAIIKVLTDENLRRRLGRGGREWVVSHFDWKERAARLSDVNNVIMETAGLQKATIGQGGK